MMQYLMWVAVRKGFDEIYKGETSDLQKLCLSQPFGWKIKCSICLISLIFDTKLKELDDINLILLWCESTWQLVVKTLGIALLPKWTQPLLQDPNNLKKQTIG